MSSTAALLTLEGIEVVYGAAILAVRDVSLHVGQGEIVALLGANGAGKSSTPRAAGSREAVSPSMAASRRGCRPAGW
jgi:ABC-type branched-subunit amino acid transport system ATPase component